MALKSEEIEFTVDCRGFFMSFENLCREAYKRAVVIHGIDDCGNSKDERFHRSSSAMKVEFDGFILTGDMGGGENEYRFKTWLESCEEDEN